MTSAAASPRVLALCSATPHASVALLREGEPTLELWAAGERQHAQSLLPLIDAILRRGDCSLDDLTGYAVCIGPGSFTSLRVGLATLKGLAFGSATPVAPVSSLRVLAASARGDTDRPIIGMLDAMRDEVYAAAYEGASRGWAPLPEVLPERVYNAAELAERIPANSLLTGGGTRVVYPALRALLGAGIEIAEPLVQAQTGGETGIGTDLSPPGTPGEADLLIGPPCPGEPSAAVTGRLALAALQDGEGISAANLVPRYVRRAEAEVLRTRERFEAAPGPHPNPPAGFDTTGKLS